MIAQVALRKWKIKLSAATYLVILLGPTHIWISSVCTHVIRDLSIFDTTRHAFDIRSTRPLNIFLTLTFSTIFLPVALPSVEPCISWFLCLSHDSPSSFVPSHLPLSSSFPFGGPLILSNVFWLFHTICSLSIYLHVFWIEIQVISNLVDWEFISDSSIISLKYYVCKLSNFYCVHPASSFLFLRIFSGNKHYFLSFSHLFLFEKQHLAFILSLIVTIFLALWMVLNVWSSTFKLY